MHKDDWALVLAVICAVTGFVGMFFTLSIALGFNRHMGRWVAEKFGIYEPDYGEVDNEPTPATMRTVRRQRQRNMYM